MSYHQTGSGMPEDAVCQYGPSKLWFRGPQRNLDGSYVACVGGDETFGRFVDLPYSSVLEKRLDKKCVNLGSLFCGVEALSQDRGVLELVNGSELCVLQVPCVLGQSNRFYRVHPRRNDRFLQPTQDLLDLYPEVDFTDIHFVRHLLARLHANRDARIEVVAQELRVQWVQCLQTLLERIAPPVVLLWLRVQRQADYESEPIQVDASLIEAIKPHCARLIELPVTVSGESDELEDMLFGTLQQPMAEHMIGPSAHRAIADALVAPIRDLN